MINKNMMRKYQQKCKKKGNRENKNTCKKIRKEKKKNIKKNTLEAIGSSSNHNFSAYDCLSVYSL